MPPPSPQWERRLEDLVARAFGVCTGHTLRSIQGDGPSVSAAQLNGHRDGGGTQREKCLPPRMVAWTPGDGTNGQPKPRTHPVTGSEARGETPATCPAASTWHRGEGETSPSQSCRQVHPLLADGCCWTGTLLQGPPLLGVPFRDRHSICSGILGGPRLPGLLLGLPEHAGLSPDRSGQRAE